ncbi:hypothetical protein [Romboutsia sp. 1001285H_161024_C4]|uniref:hypothetical protein n=1 Tax=Romboutsia sp. 1001285H_161024_C4 TaxID=2787109 RepID=UPI00189A5AEA|nr:hypothetical protein [Romboutsia sp. 1001285H_161024_C4]
MDVKERIDRKIDNILDIKDKMEILQMELDSEKETLLQIMKSNNLWECQSEYGSAKIIAFDRESLIKDDVLVTIDKVNRGLQKERINVNKLMKKSKVCFVLVRGLE